MLYIIKMALSKKFRGSTTWERFQHVVEVMNIPDNYQDWDSRKANLHDYIRDWHNNFAEIMCQIFLQCFSNLVLLVPIMVAGKFVKSTKVLLWDG